MASSILEHTTKQGCISNSQLKASSFSKKHKIEAVTSLTDKDNLSILWGGDRDDTLLNGFTGNMDAGDE